MTDCIVCKKPIVTRPHHNLDKEPDYKQIHCSFKCRKKGKVARCKVCKKRFRKRRATSVCCSFTCFNLNKLKPLDKDALIAEMLKNRRGKYPNYTPIAKNLHCSHLTLTNTVKRYGLVDAKMQGPIVDGQYLPIPPPPPLPIDPNATSKETLEKELLINRKIVNDCWIWTCRINKQGYGLLWVNRPYEDEYLVKAIALYVWQDVPLDQEKYIVHKCNNKRCFNPDHFAVCNTRKQLGQLLTKYGKNRPTLGKQHPRWKVDLATALDIRDAIKLGDTNKQILKRLKEVFGLELNSHIVQHIRRKKTWKCIWKLKSEYVNV